MKNQVSATYLFPNGMVATFDRKGNPIAELQGPYSRELHIQILKASSVSTYFAGFPLISMHEPTFSKDEALAYLKLCRTEKEVYEVLELITWQRDRYELLDYQDIRVACNVNRASLSLHRTLSKLVFLHRSEPTIFIDPHGFV